MSGDRLNSERPAAVEQRGTSDVERFRNLTFDGFRRLATDPSLSCYEKIGFPNSYRHGFEEKIFADIQRKLTNLSAERQVVIDVGPGCSGLARLLIEHCRVQQHHLLLVDSQEMLDQLPDCGCARKVPAYFPRDCASLLAEYNGRVDALLAYSVLHYVFAESNLHLFVDQSLNLLAHGGQMLIGDIPNLSKRRRFFSSPAGIRYHQEFTNSTEVPVVTHNSVEPAVIDDSVLFSILMRCRAAGCDAYLMPQSGDLPMANRREDILIVKP